MNKQQAQEIIKNTFESSFDPARFTGFVKNLLNRMEDAPFTYQGQYIPDAYKQLIKKLERIGKFTDGQSSIDILIITLQKETSLERARTMQRNFIAWYLNGSRGGTMKDAALVAFVSPDDQDWRFSLVKMDYKFTETKTGKTKVKEEFTPARRWSFLVGANEKSHTAQSRLVEMLADDEQIPTLDQIENCFDIETVTKEFFLNYRRLFLRTKEELDKAIKHEPKIKADFQAKGVDTVNFAKKLLGQIIFLYFLQKKGWFGVGRDSAWGTGSKHFLRELFNRKHGNFNNFFNDILEPLFYEALRIDRSHDDDYYSRFNCKIPFLNGGLFDPIGNYDWVHTDILLPDKLFSNTQKTPEGDTGDGILDIFDRYNFTVKEDEPLEKEVAIDPELLGKAYEKFNAIRPDNFEDYKKALQSGRTGEETKFNKQFGVYYTPREIVHYMCQQSLINYLCTELNDCHSREGGNPAVSKEDIEALIHIGEQVSENEVIALIKEQNIQEGKQKTSDYKLKLPQSIRTHAKRIDEKLEEITVCDPAVGSGAFPVGMMSEIVRARNVLSNFLNDGFRTAYEFKRRCIEHSLYGVDIDPGAVEIAKLRLWLSLVVDEDDIKNIKPLPNLDYKIVCGNSLLGYPYRPQGLDEIEKLKDRFFNETRPAEKRRLREEINNAIYGLYKNSAKTLGYQVSMDFQINFSEVFHYRGGFDVVMANPPYIDSETMTIRNSEERELLKSHFMTAKGNWDLFVVFIEKGISIVRGNGVFTYIIPNKLIGADYTKVLKEFLSNMHIKEIRDYSRLNVFQEADVYPITIVIKKQFPDEKCCVNMVTMEDLFKPKQEIRVCTTDFKSDVYWDKYFLEQDTLDLLLKIWHNSKLVEGFKNIFGAATVNEAYRIKEFIKDSKNLKGKKLVNTGTIDRYVCLWGLKSTTYIKDNYQYPMVSNEDLKTINPTRLAQSNASKIIIAGMSKYIEAIYDDGEILAGKSTTIILDSTDRLLTLLGILNSKLITFFVDNFYRSLQMAGGYINVNKEIIANIPLAHFHVNQEVNTIVKKIIAFRETSADYDTSDLEKILDDIIYDMYGLTKKEVSLIRHSMA